MQKFSVIISISTCSLLLCLSCNSAKQMPANYQGTQLIFGEGGGVTGQAKIYYILESGMIFKSEGIVEPTVHKYGRISSEVARRLINNYQVLQLNDIVHNYPGNRYQFVEWKHEGQNHKITWGDSEHAVDQKVKLFYDLLNHEINTIKNQK